MKKYTEQFNRLLELREEMQHLERLLNRGVARHYESNYTNMLGKMKCEFVHLESDIKISYEKCLWNNYNKQDVREELNELKEIIEVIGINMYY